MENYKETELIHEQTIVVQHQLLEFIQAAGDKGRTDVEVDEWFDNYDYSKLEYIYKLYGGSS